MSSHLRSGDQIPFNGEIPVYNYSQPAVTSNRGEGSAGIVEITWGRKSGYTVSRLCFRRHQTLCPSDWSRRQAKLDLMAPQLPYQRQ